MNAKEEFDLIAPIAIYHFADILFKPQAQKAKRKAQKAGILPKGKLDDMAPHVADRYNALFQQVVLEVKPDWVPIVDMYGAKGFRTNDGIMLCGDDGGFYAWYETADLIYKRIYPNIR